MQELVDKLVLCTTVQSGSLQDNEVLRLNFVDNTGHNQLMRAIALNQNYLISEDLIKNVAGASDEEYKWNSLHFAAYFGNLLVAKALVERDSSLINQQEISGLTPLHIAVIQGNRDMAVFLVNNFASLNIAENDFQNTPLHFAAFIGNFEMLDILRKRHPDIVESRPFRRNCKNIWAGTKLSLGSTTVTGASREPIGLSEAFSGMMRFEPRACVNDVIHSLKKRGSLSNENIDGDTPLHIAVSQNMCDFVEFMFKTESKEKVMHLLSIKNNHGLTAVEEALPENENMNMLFARFERHTNDLAWAIRKGYNEKATELMLNSPALVDGIKGADGIFSPLGVAISTNNVDMGQALLMKKAPTRINSGSYLSPSVWCALRQAVSENQQRLFRLIAAAPQNHAHFVDSKNKYSLMHLAAIANSPNLLNEIGDLYGEMLEQVDAAGYTPLYRAVVEKQRSAIQYLMNARASLQRIVGNINNVLQLVLSVNDLDFLKFMTGELSKHRSDNLWRQLDLNLENIMHYAVRSSFEVFGYVVGKLSDMVTIGKFGEMCRDEQSGQSPMLLAAKLNKLEMVTAMEMNTVRS